MPTLEDALDKLKTDVRKSGIPLCVFPMSLYLWLDTNLKTCAPITGTMKVRFNANEAKVCDIIRAIDKATPIFKIKRRHSTYHVEKIEEFMNKRCEV
jgi:hypothetical protein